MSISPAKSAPTLGSFALVTYLPDPLGSFLTELRRCLPGDKRPEAHITFLPPRPLSLPIEIASREITELLSSVEAFELELGNLKLFPGSNMLYLSVENGSQELLNLHGALNAGKLFWEEHYEYIPHLTLSDALSENQLRTALEQAERAWNTSGHSRSFVVNDIILLWQPGGCSDRNWTRITSFPLLKRVQSGSPQAAASS